MFRINVTSATFLSKSGNLRRLVLDLSWTDHRHILSAQQYLHLSGLWSLVEISTTVCKRLAEVNGIKEMLLLKLLETMEQIRSNSIASSSCSLDPLPAVEYEVFLSFRGPDVRTTFADFLHKFLNGKKIRTFFDDEALRKGEETDGSLAKAIGESRIYIPILSKGYASSKWCLNELALMVQHCKKDEGRHTILPIFYLIEPRDVRHCTGSYEEAMEQQSEIYDEETIEAWKEALNAVGQIKGWSVNESDGQGAVAEVVYSRVWPLVHENYKLVTNELIGIDSHVNQVIELLKLESGINIIGIHGMGGIGKTTIAKAVHDKVITQFDRRCFLENAGEILSSQNDGITTLQRINKEYPFYMWKNCEFYPGSGIRTLILRSLIKLDEGNVFWMHDHLRDLGRKIVHEEDDQHPWKRTRIWSNEDAVDMLRNGEGTERLEVLRVNMADENFELTENKFLKLSGLRYLEVYFGRLIGDFKKILRNLSWLSLYDCRSIPTDFNMKKLVILSMKGCPVGDDWREIPASIGKLSSLKILDLKEMDIVVPELPTSLKWLTLSLTSPGVPNLSELKDLEGLSWTCYALDLSVSWWKLSKLKNLTLKLLYEESVNPNYQYRYSPRRGMIALISSSPSLPSSLNTLSISGSRFQHLERLPNLVNLRNLRNLFLEYIGAHKVVGLGELSMLQKFHLSNAPNLINLDGLEHLELLKTLTVSDCDVLRKLPSLSNLIMLRELQILYCPLLLEIQGLGRQASLSYLKIHGCYRLTRVTGLDKLESLQVLKINYCTSIEWLHDLSALEHLRELNSKGCNQLTEMMGIDKLESLQELVVTECAIEELPDLSALVLLQKLNISECNELTEVKGLDKLHSLRILRITDCASIKKLPDLSAFKHLRELTITGCNQLTEVNGIERLEGSRYLTIDERLKTSETMVQSEHERLEPLHRDNNSRPKIWSRILSCWGVCLKDSDMEWL
ncbi:unnamed protein product [Linum tenue]|uniref:TIR domain-containing protein n=1 Tax=Linum tenue TaxID=586396 RepID=A0AAV0I9H3_9ROSI|nr:unnamed protein product [Linum tenue]